MTSQATKQPSPELEPHTIDPALREFLDRAPIAALIADAEQIQFANPAACEIFRAFDGLRLEAFALHDLIGDMSRHRLDAMIAGAWSNAAELAGRELMQTVDIQRLDGSSGKAQAGVVRATQSGRCAIVVLLNDVSAQENERHSLAQSREQLRRLAARLIDVREDERRRIARELHDDLGQRLSWLKMELTGAGFDATPGLRSDRLAAMLSLLDDTMRSLRTISYDLRPLMLDDLGLAAAIEWQARESARRMGIEVTTRLGCEDLPINDSTGTALFRIVQEALTNVSRHAQATDVCIELSADCEASQLMLSVTDNGVGFSESALQRQASLGLLGMEERVTLLGGRVLLDNPPEAGARVRVWLPLQTPSQAQDSTQ